ncbi:hypothetical protein [Arthrobacter sp. PAMC25284]|uniref:hypothetical protein n=1 Tax=Arthrobacter sp. PAMC25284 TaxID=2861279 RepID=UPI0021593FD1|nr:hypothetical protein [Arthrobacter sp. PAMC25284]
MKKSLRTGALASIAAAGMLLSACGFGGSGGNAGAGENTINLLVPSYSDGTKGRWESIIKDFEASNPDLKVNLEVQSWDNINDVVKTKIQGQQAPGYPQHRCLRRLRQ